MKLKPGYLALLVIVPKKSKMVRDKGSGLGFGFKISVRVGLGLSRLTGLGGEMGNGF